MIGLLLASRSERKPEILTSRKTYSRGKGLKEETG